MNRQKGQSMIEFALILPAFFLLLLGAMFCGLMVVDKYSCIHIARNATRNAAITGEATKDKVNAYVNDDGISSNLFFYQFDSSKTVVQAPSDTNPKISVTLVFTRKNKIWEDTVPMFAITKNLISADYQAKCSMRREKTQDT